MGNCKECNATLSEDVEVCPICGCEQASDNNVKIDNIDKKLTSSPTILTQPISDNNLEEKKLELERLVKRGNECFSSGRAWLGAKDRTRARKEFQRAFNYYENALKMNPNHEKAREMRSKCLFKMA